MTKSEPEKVWGGPTKRFFVSMLPRDIALSDAILDLIDNCVDGATRQIKGKYKKPDAYNGFEARLSITAKSFDISDNCGGIPDKLVKDAFLLGRPKIERDGKLPTIGMYGIGMKRAIFKMGEEAIVESYSNDGAFSVAYTKNWMDPDSDDWELPIEAIKNRSKKGVTVCIPTLRKEVAQQFGNNSFLNGLKIAISEHFGYLMQKGFAIWVNDERILPQTLKLHAADLSEQKGIRPYDFESDENGVHIRVTVGFYRPLARIEEIDAAAERPETEEAGISVICNDRLVLLNDKTMKTGWGDGGVPRYHPQFRSIAGCIIFSTDEPEKLPISTTKRDLEVGSELYLHARQYCMEGLRECTAFTNKWKGMEDEASILFERAARKDVRTEVRLAADHGSSVRGNKYAKKFAAQLPAPEQKNPMRRISFTRKADAVKRVSTFLFNENDQPPSVVGQECFDRFLKMSRQ